MSTINQATNNKWHPTTTTTTTNEEELAKRHDDTTTFLLCVHVAVAVAVSSTFVRVSPSVAAGCRANYQLAWCR